MRIIFVYVRGFEQLDATPRRGVAGDGLTEPNLYFLPYGRKMQINPSHLFVLLLCLLLTIQYLIESLTKHDIILLYP